MKLDDRSYSTKILRPKPIIHQEDDGSLLVITTSWGQAEQGQRATEEVIKYVNAAKSDIEVTSPFEFLTCFPSEVNYVRTGVLIANDLLYRGENRSEYNAGLEILVLLKKGSQLVWAQVGCPSLYIQRSQQKIQAISVSGDLSSEFSTHSEVLAPLPNQLLGIDRTCHVQCGHTMVGLQDKLILLAGSGHCPTSLEDSISNSALDLVTRNLVQEAPDRPFWLGIVRFDEES